MKETLQIACNFSADESVSSTGSPLVSESKKKRIKTCKDHSSQPFNLFFASLIVVDVKF